MSREDRQTNAMLIQAIIAILLISASVFAQPSAEVTGPLKARHGQKIVLRVVQDDADSVKWDVHPKLEVPDQDEELADEKRRELEDAGWTPPEKTSTEPLWSISDDGRSLQCASYPGTIEIAVGVVVDGELAVKHYTVTISPIRPAPDPEDDDDPGPALTGFALEVFQEAQNVDRRLGEAEELSGAYTAVSTVTGGIEEMAAESRRVIRPLVTDEIQLRWERCLGLIRDRLDEAAREGDADAVREVFADAGKGLGAVE